MRGGAGYFAPAGLAGRKIEYVLNRAGHAVREGAMRQIVNVNPTSEHGLFLCLFVTNGGGW